MSKSRPNFRVFVKSKSENKYQDLIALWRNEKGIGGQFDKAVKKFVVEIDGQLYDVLPENVWVNMKEETPDMPTGEQQKKANEQREPDDNIPF